MLTAVGRPWCRWAVTITVLGMVACSSAPQRPVFYPNAHYNSVTQAQVHRDTDDCVQLAGRSGIDATQDGDVGRKAATGAVIGGVGAGAWGLVRGDAGERAVAGAAAGAATGGVKGVLDGERANPLFQRFVERCLTDRGYDIIGWQ